MVLSTSHIHGTVDMNWIGVRATNFSSGGKSGCIITGNHAITKLVYSAASEHSGDIFCRNSGRNRSWHLYPRGKREEFHLSRIGRCQIYLIQLFWFTFSSGCSVAFRDNLNTARIIRNGSATGSLHALALDVFRFCLRHDIHIISQFRRRETSRFHL